MELNNSKFLLCGGNLERLNEKTIDSLKFNRISVYNYVSYLKNNGVVFYLYESYGSPEYILIKDNIYHVDISAKDVIKILFGDFLRIQNQQRNEFYKKGGNSD